MQIWPPINEGSSLTQDSSVWEFYTGKMSLQNIWLWRLVGLALGLPRWY